LSETVRVEGGLGEEVRRYYDDATAHPDPRRSIHVVDVLCQR
jgi:hypothetical protein